MHAKLALSIRVSEIHEYMAQGRTPQWYNPYIIFVLQYNYGRYVPHLKANTGGGRPQFYNNAQVKLLLVYKNEAHAHYSIVDTLDYY